MIVTKLISSDIVNSLISHLSQNWNVSSQLFNWSRGKEIKYLDLGCGYPNQLIAFDQKMNLVERKGVDRYPERICANEYTIRHPEIEGKSFSEIYNKIETKKFTEAEFNERFVNCIDFQQDLLAFLRKNKTVFDFIMAKNSLHFMPNTLSFQQCLEWINIWLAPDGIYSILIQNKSLQDSFPDNHWSGRIDDILEVFENTALTGNLIIYYDNDVYYRAEFTNLEID